MAGRWGAYVRGRKAGAGVEFTPWAGPSPHPWGAGYWAPSLWGRPSPSGVLGLGGMTSPLLTGPQRADPRPLPICT